MELLIFSYKSTNRLHFTLKLIFGEILKTSYRLTTDRSAFIAHTGPKLSYGLNPIADEFFIKSKELLFEVGILEYEVIAIPYKHTQAIFPSSAKSDFTFDVLAASFYMASRYEEYLPHKRDNHNRFDAKESIAYQKGFLEFPVVHIWSEGLWEALFLKYPQLTREYNKYKFITTIDVDNAFAYEEKGVVRSVAGILKNIVKFEATELIERLSVLMGVKQDPYDTFDYQLDLIKKHDLEVVYFILLGDYGYNDKNIPVTSLKFRSLIKALSDYAKVGIHPSYGSNKSFKQLQKEVGRLSDMIHVQIDKSRQHFLKLQLPDTYRDLLELNITNDYTMGYACYFGFRSGMCIPYHFYDLDLEVETPLMIHPFAVMEGTLKYYLSISPADASAYYKKLIDEVRAVNGTFISLWHNDSINDRGFWIGWKNVFEEMIEYGKS